MEQAGCERNKGRHGRIMNNLVGAQQDLNTWATECVCVWCRRDDAGALHSSCGNQSRCSIIKNDQSSAFKESVMSGLIKAEQSVCLVIPCSIYQCNKASFPPFAYSLHFLYQCRCLCECVIVAQPALRCMVYYHQQLVNINRICFVCLLQYLGSVWTCPSTITTMWEMSNQ